MGVEYKHSGEVQCTAYLPSNPIISQVSSYTDLAVLPAVSHVDVIESVNDSEEKQEEVEVEAEENKEEEQIEDPVCIIRTPEDCTALIGGTVILVAEFTGYPEPTVSWLRAVSKLLPIFTFYIVLCLLYHQCQVTNKKILFYFDSCCFYN